jgi:hypothetical protein
MEWKPATSEDVTKILQNDLARCDDCQIATFERYAVKPYSAPIFRYGRMESVIVVARNGDEVIYWEDVEEALTSPQLRLMEEWLSTGAIRTNWDLLLTRGLQEGCARQTPVRQLQSTCVRGLPGPSPLSSGSPTSPARPCCGSRASASD